MPRVVSKSWFDNLSPRLKIMLAGIAALALCAGIYFGFQAYRMALAAREQREFTNIMAQSDAYSKTGKYETAAKLLEQYLKGAHTPPHRYQALTSLAYSYQLSGQADQAFATFKQVDAMHIQPANVYVLRALAYLSIQHNDRPGAIRYYERALAAARLQSDPEITPYVPQWEVELKSLESSPSSPASP